MISDFCLGNEQENDECSEVAAGSCRWIFIGSSYLVCLDKDKDSYQWGSMRGSCLDANGVLRQLKSEDQAAEGEDDG
jgi:hypothetical protein